MNLIRPKNPEQPKPEQATTEEILANIAECSKNAGRRLATYWVVLLYGVITLAGITDKDIFLNTGARLPIVNVTIPLTGFWLVFPPIIFVLFLLFAMQIYRLEELRNALSSDVRNEAIRFYPWFWSIGASAHGIIGWLWKCWINSAIWGILPIALSYAYVTCIGAHSTLLRIYLFAWYLIGIIVTFRILKQVSSLIDSKMGEPFKWSFIKRRQQGFYSIFVFTFVGLCLVQFTPVGKKFGRSLDVSYQILVEKPPYDHPNAYWIDLSNRNYEGANLYLTVLRRALLDGVNFSKANLTWAIMDSSRIKFAIMDSVVLREAHLEHSIFDSVNLSYANLRGAHLENTYFGDAHLEFADFRWAILSHSDLPWSHLENAALIETNLDSASLFGAYLNQCDFTKARLRYVHFEHARGLTADQLKRAWTLFEARSIDEKLSHELEQCCGYLFVHPDSINREDYPPFGNKTWPPDTFPTP